MGCIHIYETHHDLIQCASSTTKATRFSWYTLESSISLNSLLKQIFFFLFFFHKGDASRLVELKKLMIFLQCHLI